MGAALVAMRTYGIVIHWRKVWGKLWRANFPSSCTEVIRWHKLSSIPSPVRSFTKRKLCLELVPNAEQISSTDSSQWWNAFWCQKGVVLDTGDGGQRCVGMTGGWDESLSSFLGTHRSVSRNHCKHHELWVALWLNSGIQAGYGERWVQAAIEDCFPLFQWWAVLEHRGFIVVLARPALTLPLHHLLETNKGLSREGQGQWPPEGMKTLRTQNGPAELWQQLWYYYPGYHVFLFSPDFKKLYIKIKIR